MFRGLTQHLAETAGDDKRGWLLDQIFAVGNCKKFVWWAPGAKLRVMGVADLGDVAMVELEEIGVPYIHADHDAY